MAGTPSRLKQQLAELTAAEKSDSGGVVVSAPADGVVVHPGQPASSTPAKLTVVETTVPAADSVDSVVATPPSAKDQLPELIPPTDVTKTTRLEIEPQIVAKERGGDEDTYQERYLALKGKYDAEVSAVKARLDAIEKNKGFLEGKIEAQAQKVAGLEKENSDLRNALDSANPALMLEGLSDEEKEAYAESAPVMAKLARHVADKSVSKLTEKLAVFERADAERMEREAAEKITRTRMEEQSFMNSVANRVAGSMDEFERINKSVEFDDFLNRAVKGGMTVKEMLMSAHNKRNLNDVVYWFDQFKASKNPAIMPTSLPVVPSKTTGGGDVPSDKPILKMSDRKKLSEDFRKKLISFDEYTAGKKIYDQAEAEGRLK